MNYISLDDYGIKLSRAIESIDQNLVNELIDQIFCRMEGKGEIHLIGKIDSKADVTVDGRKLCEIVPNDTIKIKKASKKTLLIHPPGYDYFEVLRSKLHWGQDNRMRKPLAEEK